MLTARSTKWYIVNDQMVNELIFDILDYRKKSSFLPKLLAYIIILLYLCSGFQSENGRNCDIIRNTNTLWIYKETSM